MYRIWFSNIQGDWEIILLDLGSKAEKMIWNVKVDLEINLLDYGENGGKVISW